MNSVIGRPFIWVLTIVLILSLSACGSSGGGNDVSSSVPDAPDPISEADDAVSLEDLDGWWYLVDDYPVDGVALFEVFKLDAAAKTWTTYDEWGDEYYVDSVYLTEDGKLGLTFELGDIYFTLDGNDILLDEDGRVVFMMGWPPEEPSAGSLDGKWYKNADTSAEYYVFKADAYERFSPYNAQAPTHSGSFLTREHSYYQHDGNLASGTMVEFDDPYATDTLMLSVDGTYFYILHGDTFYMREDAIETPQGEHTIEKYRLIAIQWRCETDTSIDRLELYDNDVFVINRQANGTVTLLDSGSWTLDGDTLTFTSADGSSEEVMLSEDMQSITLERYEATFTDRNS